MPAARPRASFEPIPPDFDVRTFVETADNFQYADRISYEMIANNGMEQFEKLVLLHVIIGGKPLVIDGFEEVLDPWTFTPSWLRDNMGDKPENARNLTTKENIPLTIKHYLKNMGKLTEQFFEDAERYRDTTRQRVYLKDIDCPNVWRNKVEEHIPAALFYLNESTGEIGGPGALDKPSGRKGRGIGRAGDLMSSLPPEMRAENLMCYIGHEGTYTPAHREMCASLGQNIMVNASTTVGEDGKPERPGSSLWFMTEMKDRHLVSEYWLSTLGHDIEVENHFAQLIAWRKAPFKTYVVEQRPGDFILIPPLAPHQVWNRGTRTMKVAWNRTTVETLELAMSEALPASRIVCRDEQYKNKAIIYYSLLKYSDLIKIARARSELGGEQEETIHRSLKIRHVQRDFKRLFDLYKNILLSEMFAPEAQHTREHPESLPFDGNVTCAYCRCNIFNRFLTCKSCKNLYSEEMDEPYDVCMDCYCMGRSCGCQSGYTWVEQWKWKDLIHRYEEWRAQIVEIDGHITEKTPLPLPEERRYFSKKTLAQVCQEQLKLRPFVDIKNPHPANDESEEDEPQTDANGYPKPAKKKSKQWLNPRSVECLVDFGISNLNWVREEDVAMANRRAAAEQEKLANPEFDDRYMDLNHDTSRNGIAYSPVEESGFDGHTNGANGHGLLSAPDDPFGENPLHPDPDPDGEIPRLGKRNRDDEHEEETASRRKKKKKQKRKDDTPQRLEPKSTSGKQYQKEVQRKLLEEAKRKDRYILVAARMKGKSKVVRLQLDPDLLEAIQNRPVLEHPGPEHERESSEEPEDVTGHILQSDIMAARRPAVTPAQKEKAQKTFRVRVNEDETYSTRKRNPEASLPSKPRRPGQRRSRFEEITIDSEDEDDDIMTGHAEPGAGRSTGRTSNWLARKNEGEEDLPTELPKDFRDGLINPNREKNMERNRIRNQALAELRKSMPSNPIAKIRPPGAGQPLESTSSPLDQASADEDGVGVEDEESSEALLLAQSAASALDAQRKAEEEKRRTAAAEKEAQENLRAKMGIAEEFLSDGEGESLNGFIDTLAAEDEPLAHERVAEPSSSPTANGPPLQSTNSLLSKPGMEGKKIKIVSKRSTDGASKTTTTTTIKAPLSGFTAVNKKVSKSINVSESESDSEDEIPATAPVTKRPVGRPPGRPPLVPTRGSSSGRGRGRPRGRPRKSV
ncbi:hypothetical protein SLS60_000483 [Paraconiothyrium brasiliense]|uniref:JmjC domain-containing protein n=1 Tax=Paraconiothyrium brasiliense TaxID=300254 RepID=A0ABR3S6D7_9PLEO